MSVNAPITAVPNNLLPSDKGMDPETYFRRTYPAEAWVLDIPDLRNALMPVLQAGGDPGRIQAALEGSDWWKTHGDAAKQWSETEKTNPAEAARQVDKMAAHIKIIAGRMGVSIGDAQARQLGTDAATYGWSDDELNLTVKGYGQSQAPTTPGGTVQGTMFLLRQAAHDQFLYFDDATLNTWARGIANGERTMDAFKGYAAQQAAYNRPELGAQLNSGATMADLTNSLKNQIAQTMNMDPTQIDFANDPRWGRVIDYVPPGESARRIMTAPEALAFARSQPEYRNGAEANSKAADLTVAIDKAWGKLS